VFGPVCNAGPACAFPGASVSPVTSKVGWARFAGDGTNSIADNPGAVSFNSPRNIIIAPDGKLVLSDTGNNRVRRVNLQDNSIFTIVGNGSNLDTGDEGPAWQASLFHPRGLAYDS
jgi:DNA-binding beta-propeller fold protein YncE